MRDAGRRRAASAPRPAAGRPGSRTRAPWTRRRCGAAAAGWAGRVAALGDRELGALDPAERLEGRPGRGAAVGAVAVERVAELVRDLVAHGAALAAAGEKRHGAGPIVSGR